MNDKKKIVQDLKIGDKCWLFDYETEELYLDIIVNIDNVNDEYDIKYVSGRVDNKINGQKSFLYASDNYGQFVIFFNQEGIVDYLKYKINRFNAMIDLINKTNI